jgi:hypothetical protein
VSRLTPRLKYLALGWYVVLPLGLILAMATTGWATTAAVPLYAVSTLGIALAILRRRGKE